MTYLRVLISQKNSINLTHVNSEILLMQHTRIVVPRPEVLLFTRNKLHQWSRQISETCSKRPPGVSVHKAVWHLLTPCFLFHQLLQLRRFQRTQNWTLMTLNQQI